MPVAKPAGVRNHASRKWLRGYQVCDAPELGIFIEVPVVVVPNVGIFQDLFYRACEVKFFT